MARSLEGLLLLAMVVMMGGGPSAEAQISTPCNASMLNSLFTPCVNFLTSSSGNGASPTTECCSALKSLTSGGMECLCLLVTASVPFKIPINRTVAISLPRACSMPGVPVQCKASSSPLPAPGPISLGPSPSPLSAPTGFTPTPSPQASDLPSPSLAPESETTPPVDSGTPPSTGSGRFDLTPSSAMPLPLPSYYSVFSSLVVSLFIITMGFSLFNDY